MTIRKIYTIAGSTAQKITLPVHPDAAEGSAYSKPQRLYLYAETGAWRFRVGDYSALGSELVTNGAFASTANWTLGTGAAIAAGKLTWDASQSANSDASQTFDDNDQEIIAGELYTVVFTTSGRTAGNVRAVLGGTAATNRAGNTTYTENVYAGADGTIKIRADLDFDGSVDNVSVKRAVLVVTAPTVAAAYGTGSWAIAAAGYKDIPAPPSPTEVTLVGTDGSSVLTYYWE